MGNTNVDGHCDQPPSNAHDSAVLCAYRMSCLAFNLARSLPGAKMNTCLRSEIWSCDDVIPSIPAHVSLLAVCV